MAEIWKSPEAREAVLARYARFLEYWPRPNEQLRLGGERHQLGRRTQSHDR